MKLKPSKKWCRVPFTTTPAFVSKRLNDERLYESIRSDDTMKICMLCTSYPRSKKDHWVPFTHSLAKELAKEEEIVVITSHGSDTKDFEIRDNVQIYRFQYFFPPKYQKLTYMGGMSESFRSDFLAKTQLPFFLLSFFLKSLFICRKCNVINAHWTISGLIAIVLKWIYKKPVILTIHGGGIRNTPEWLSRFILKHVDFVTTAHPDMLEKLKSWGMTKNVFDIKNMLDYDRWNLDIKTDLKKRYNLENKKIVTFVGRMEHSKDPLTFAKSVPYVVERNNNVRFVMVGDGHLLDEVKQTIRNLNIQKYVIDLTGGIPDISPILKASDLFVAVSPVENCFSTTIIEAMTLGIPCIITKAGLTEKYFTHKNDSYLIPPKNEKTLAEAIIYLLENDKMLNELSKNGHMFLVKNGFTRKEVLDKMMSVFEQAIRNKNG